MVRGFALCGVLVADVGPIAAVGVGGEAGRVPGWWMGLLVEQRFFPVFSVLFGIGFTLMLESAACRVARPRGVLVRRLVVLLGFGLVHLSLLWQGDILALYAVVGLAVLLPASWLPRWAAAGAAGVLVVGPLLLGGGGAPLVPGLVLAGAVSARYGAVQVFDRAGWGVAGAALICAAGAVPALVVQLDDPSDEAGSALAGLLVAGVYVCVVLLALRTRLRGLLAAVFAPLGRMSLTCYLSATVLVLAAAPLVGAVGVLPVAAAILVVQWTGCALWLRSHRRGPLEWVWHRLTWPGPPGRSWAILQTGRR
ncbi:DUF418 domain-containing protein [Actinocorallia aurea]